MVQLSLRSAKDALNELTQGMEFDKYSNDRTELEEIRKKMQETIVLLEERLSIYRRTIRKISEEINYAVIKGYFEDPKTADSVVDKITLFYEDVFRDSTIGCDIRSTMVALGKPELQKDSTRLTKCIEKCFVNLRCVQKDFQIYIKYKRPLNESYTLQESLLKLSEILLMIKKRQLSQTVDNK